MQRKPLVLCSTIAWLCITGCGSHTGEPNQGEGATPDESTTRSSLDRLLNPTDAERLRFEESFRDSSGKVLHVRVLDPKHPDPWWSQLLTIVVTDSNDRQLATQTVDPLPALARSHPGFPAFHSSRLDRDGDIPVLAVTCLHRAGAYCTYRYELTDSEIRAVAAVEMNGRLHADIDWKDQRAGIAGTWVEFADGTLWFNHEFDAETGLPLHGDPQDNYSREYSHRVRELIAEHGLPPWSVKHKYKVWRIDKEDYAAMLDSNEMKQITKTPHHVNDSITIANGRFTDSRWGSSNGFSVFTKIVGGPQMAMQAERIDVGRLTKYPEVVFIRAVFDDSHQWVGAFTTDGTHLGSVDRHK